MPVLIRLDVDVLTQIRRRARAKQIGYHTLINDTLAAYVAGALRMTL